MTRIADDLFSNHFDLLIPCPNAKHGAGQNNDKYLPNPQHCSPLAMAQFTFVGKLMGISLRTRLCMSFELPSLVWKGLTGLAIGGDDLRAIDTISCQFLEAVRGEQCTSSSSDDGIRSDSNGDSSSISAAERAFEELYGGKLVFTYTGSDGKLLVKPLSHCACC
jgi:HECT-domain (ubiquitin-transferase)